MQHQPFNRYQGLSSNLSGVYEQLHVLIKTNGDARVITPWMPFDKNHPEHQYRFDPPFIDVHYFMDDRGADVMSLARLGFAPQTAIDDLDSDSVMTIIRKAKESGDTATAELLYSCVKKIRRCYSYSSCHTILIFGGFYKVNKDRQINELASIWLNDLFELYCCECYEKFME
jgi:hypothetical protein